MPVVPAAGVPLSTPAVVKFTPVGKGPVSLKVGTGNPVAMTENEPAAPNLNIVEAALVMAGPWLIANIKLWVAFDPTPLLAVIVMG